MKCIDCGKELGKNVENWMTRCKSCYFKFKNELNNKSRNNDIKNNVNGILESNEDFVPKCADCGIEMPTAPSWKKLCRRCYAISMSKTPVVKPTIDEPVSIEQNVDVDDMDLDTMFDDYID